MSGNNVLVRMEMAGSDSNTSAPSAASSVDRAWMTALSRWLGLLRSHADRSDPLDETVVCLLEATVAAATAIEHLRSGSTDHEVRADLQEVLASARAAVVTATYALAEPRLPMSAGSNSRGGNALSDSGKDSVHRIVLGGRFGEEDERVSMARLDRFAEAGGLFIDTAHSYAGGEAERVIGRWLRVNPGTLAVVDKIGHPDDRGRLDLSRSRLETELTDSLRRLGVLTLDIVLLHRDDPARPVAELAETLADFVHSGRARQVGVSNWSPDRLAQLVIELGEHGVVPVVSYQYSLAVPAKPLWPGTRHADAALLAVINDHELPLFGWAAQARGFFAGRVEPTADSGLDPFDTEENHARRRRCRELAERLGTRPETVALAWSLRAGRSYPIVGPRDMAELDHSLAASRLVLDDSTVEWLARGAA